MLMKNRKKRPPRRQQMTIEEFDRDSDAVFAAANGPGGLDVVDAQGKLRFHMWIPHYALRDTLE